MLQFASMIMLGIGFFVLWQALCVFFQENAAESHEETLVSRSHATSAMASPKVASPLNASPKPDKPSRPDFSHVCNCFYSFYLCDGLFSVGDCV